MPIKTKTVTLKGPLDRLLDNNSSKTGVFYKVDRVTDSIEFAPGDWITKDQAQELCGKHDWKVTVVNYYSK